MDMYYADHGYSTCVTCAGSLTKRQKGRGLFCQVFRNLYLYHRFILYGSQFLQKYN